MEKKVQVLIRVCLSAALCYMVFRETGAWTAVSFALVFIGQELNSLCFRLISRTIDEINGTNRTVMSMFKRPR